jgi:hypothetical protein
MLVGHRVDPGDIQATRETYLELSAGPFSRAAIVLGFGGFVSLVGAILFWDSLPIRLRAICLLSPLSLSAFSLFSGGRQTLLQLILVSYFALSVRKRFITGRPLPRRAWMGLILFVVAAFAYGMAAATQRNSTRKDTSKLEYLEQIFAMRLHPRIRIGLEQCGDVVRDGAAETIVYATHTIPNFCVFWDGAQPRPYLGLWELPFLARRLNNLGVVTETVDERMADVSSIFARQGWFSQGWGTAIRDLVLDFGAPGAAVVLFGFGCISAAAYRQLCSRAANWNDALWVVWIDVACVYSVLLAIVLETLMFFFLVFVVVTRVGGRLPRVAVRE